MALETGCPLTIVRDGDLAIVRFAEPTLDESNVELLGMELDRLARAPVRKMHLDLGGLQMVSSTWLCRFVTLNKTLQAAGGHLVLFNAGPEVREEFEVTRLDQVLDVR
jgi:anti-anti-sigma factor